jgi:glycosyltransferase involved in cell wall biosynthesis
MRKVNKILKTKIVFFYSSVKNKELFHIQRFYHIDIELIKNLGYTVFESNKIFDFCFFWKYDIAFIYFYRLGLLPAILSNLFFKKVYFTGGIDSLEQSTTVHKEYVVQKIFFKLCHLFSDMSILVSSSDENNVKKIYHGKLPKRTCLSFHTIDIEKFVYTDLSKKENIFTTIAWMESIGNIKRKGVDKALIVFKYLIEKEEYADAKFYIIGKEGEGSDYLRKLCMDMKIVDNVIFTGSIDEKLKIDILIRSKYYFQLSTFEGFGIAAIEALAAKNIVIHSGNGGLKETMKDYGIKVDIFSDLDEQIDSIYDQLINFNKELLDRAQKHINDNYSNIRRQKDFEKIFTN